MKHSENFNEIVHILQFEINRSYTCLFFNFKLSYRVLIDRDLFLKTALTFFVIGNYNLHQDTLLVKK